MTIAVLNARAIGLLLLGPVSSGSPKGQGPLFSWLFIFVGSWVLIGSWNAYLRERKKVNLSNVSLLNLAWVTGLAVLFLVLGIRGVIQ